MSEDVRFKITTPEELNKNMKDEKYIKEFCNYITFEGLSQPQAFIKTFNIDSPMSDYHKTKMYRWLKKDAVVKWKKKAESHLSLDLVDKKMELLNRMHKIAMDDLTTASGEKIKVPLHIQANTAKDWLDSIKSDPTIKVQHEGVGQINVVQLVQEKLNSITAGATIEPDIKRIEYTDAEVIDAKDD